MSTTQQAAANYKDKIDDVIHYGEKSRQTEDDFGKVELKYKEKNVSEFIIDWLNRNKVRTPFKILDLFNELDDYVEVLRKRDKSFEKTFKRKIAQNQIYDEYLQDRTRLFSGIIRKHEEILNEDSYPPELDILVQSDLIYANNVVLKELKLTQNTINSLGKIKRMHRSHQRFEISKRIRDVILSVIIIMLREIEIEYNFSMGENTVTPIDLLEWDLNTLHIYNTKLADYAAIIIKKGKRRSWSNDLTKESRELIRLFSGYGEGELNEETDFT